MTEHDTTTPDRYDRAKEILDAVNAEFPGHQLGWNSGRPWLKLADTLVAKDTEIAATRQALVETVQAQQPAGRLRELFEENHRLILKLEVAREEWAQNKRNWISARDANMTALQTIGELQASLRSRRTMPADAENRLARELELAWMNNESLGDFQATARELIAEWFPAVGSDTTTGSGGDQS